MYCVWYNSQCHTKCYLISTLHTVPHTTHYTLCTTRWTVSAPWCQPRPHNPAAEAAPRPLMFKGIRKGSAQEVLLRIHFSLIIYFLQHIFAQNIFLAQNITFRAQNIFLRPLKTKLRICYTCELKRPSYTDPCNTLYAFGGDCFLPLAVRKPALIVLTAYHPYRLDGATLSKRLAVSRNHIITPFVPKKFRRCIPENQTNTFGNP